MSLKKTVLRSAYAFGGFEPFRWANRRRVAILTYHRFCEKSDPFRVSRDQFRSHLEYLKRHCNVVSLANAVEAVRGQANLPPNAVAITIDDGYLDAYEIAFPLLREFNFPATLFAVTDFVQGEIWLWTDIMRFLLLNSKGKRLTVEFADGSSIAGALGSSAERMLLADKVNGKLKKLSRKEVNDVTCRIADDLEVVIPGTPPKNFAAITLDQAREMDLGGCSIESHTVTHPILTKIDGDLLDFEIGESRRRLEIALDKEVSFFCYPNGDYDERAVVSAANAGYAAAVTTEHGFADGAQGMMKLKRFDAPAAIEDFAQYVSGFELFKRWIRKSA